jgi:hypothetical protein
MTAACPSRLWEANSLCAERHTRLAAAAMTSRRRQFTCVRGDDALIEHEDVRVGLRNGDVQAVIGGLAERFDAREPLDPATDGGGHPAVCRYES